MKKLLFIIPMHISFDSFLKPAHNSRTFTKTDGKNYNSLSTDLPLGALSMSAYLKKHVEIDVQLVDFNAEINSLTSFDYINFRECCENIITNKYINNSINFDFIGISSLFSPSYNNFLDCGFVSRKLFPKAFIMGGGNIPTNSYESIYKSEEANCFDALCYGEGEKPLLELILAEDKNQYLKNSKQWITKDKLFSQNQLLMLEHNFIEDLDEIPFFDYDLCDFDKHASNQVSSSFHNVSNKRGFHIMTSRGCPYLCTFCASHKTHGRKMRFHSLERIKEDLGILVTKYNAGTIIFQDDHLMSSKDRVYSILEIIKTYDLESLYQNGLTLYALDLEMLTAFYQAGVRHLVLPVESGSERTLKELMKKPLKFRISEQVARDCRELGIYTNTNILIGMPGERVFDLDEGRINLRKVSTNWFNIACASPIVGSDMHKTALDNNYIKINNLGSDYRTASIQTEDFTSDFIQDYQYRMNLELNFVNNNDIKVGEYKVALMAFDNVIRIRPDHAFAHYYAAICYKALNEQEQMKEHYSIFKVHFNSNFWIKWVNFFELVVNEADFLKLSLTAPPIDRLFNLCSSKILADQSE
jgi:anaerobic magnesium-protoporphyrin IX monomethyl ester cyclase